MKCPQCNHSDTKVIDTRVSLDHASIRRRRKCPQCGYKFSTIETYCKSELVVIKRDGSIEGLDYNKIINSLKKAIKADTTRDPKIDAVVKNVTQEVTRYPSTKIPTEIIGQIVMKTLKDIDPIAYLRFASIYKNFHEAHEFEQEFKNLNPTN